VRAALEQVERGGWLGLLLFVSMALDGASLLAWRITEKWEQPVTQIAAASVVILVSLWPFRVAATSWCSRQTERSGGFNG
jgi:uncharacterized membrane protein